MTAAERGRVSFVASATEAGATIQKVLHERTGLSNAAVKGVVAAGGVAVNGRTTNRPDLRLKTADRVEARWDPDRRYRAVPPSRLRGPGFVIVHADDDVVVVDKEAGVLTVPTTDHRGESVSESLEDIYRVRGFKDASVHAVHRIDRYTSGLVAFARHGAARVALRREFAAGRPTRIYLAVVEGRLEASAGRLEHRLVENARSLKVAVAASAREGRRSVCRYRLIEAFAHAALVEVTLETGRRNQIRVQFAAERHPLVGDRSYGRPSAHIGRTALHAHRLAFDTLAGPRLTFVSEPPHDFRKLVEALRRGASPSEEPQDVAPPSRPTRPRATGRRNK